ncbi:hypothetical protein D3C85_1325870 [compost metagenome]
MDVLDGLDEVRLAKDEVCRLRLVDFQRDELHLERLLPRCGCQGLATSSSIATHGAWLCPSSALDPIRGGACGKAAMAGV